MWMLDRFIVKLWKRHHVEWWEVEEVVFDDQESRGTVARESEAWAPSARTRPDAWRAATLHCAIPSELRPRNMAMSPCA